jgi:twitching motility protein PilT
MEINDLLKKAVESHASDLHILPGKPPELRIYGDLQPIEGMGILTPEDSKRIVYSSLSPEEQKKFEEDLVLDISITVQGIGHFRIAAFHQMNGVAGVFRVITERVPTFDELGLPVVLKRVTSLPHGLVLVAGPTGSGKSTTLAAMLDYINESQSSHIITIEDPIEYKYTMNKATINQLQVGRDTPDFNTALRASLRQDPDIILLGELRDLETIRLALIAAETGHLVLSTLHASSAPTSINRIIDSFPHEEKTRIRNALADALQCVVCQTLVKKATGGRVAAFEIMIANPAIRHLIRQDLTAQLQSTIQTSGDVGMCTMEQYLHQLATKRIITNATERSEIAKYVVAKGHNE